MTRGLFRFVSGTIPKDQVQLQTPMVTIGIRGTIVKTQVDENETIFFEHGQGTIKSNTTGETVNMDEGDQLVVDPGGHFSKVHKPWLAGDDAVDFGMNPFGRHDGGPDAGSTGGDGAGAAGGEGNRGN